MAQQDRFDWWVTQPDAPPTGRTAVRPRPEETAAGESRAAVFRSVQAGPAFQAVRRDYRAFAFPATAAFLGWYLLYVAAQAVAPGLLARPLAGPFSLAWLLALLQFASTFLLTWLYARNARTRRDRAALDLRWDTQDQLR
jgi:uncharacterized membrane protein (DUF485 family)